MLSSLSTITTQPLDDQAIERNLALLSFEGGAFSLMVGVGETYLAALVIAVGLGDYLAGLITTVPVLGGACLQLVSFWGVKWCNSNRGWAAFAAFVQAISVGAIAVLVSVERVSAGPLFLAAMFYWFGGLAAGPAWNAWVDHLVPSARRATFFGSRAKICQTCVLCGILLGGGLLRLPFGTKVFALLFGLGAACRFVSAISIALGTELPTWRPRSGEEAGFAATLRNLGPEAKVLLVYLLAMQTAVYIAAPYFTPYMLKHLKLGYLEYTWLISLGFVGKILAMPWAGRAASKYGTRLMLIAGGVGIVPIAACWLVSSSLLFLSAVQLVGGALWACYELATMLLFFEKIPQRQRVAALSVYNVGNATAMVAGSFVGGMVLQTLSLSVTGYFVVFLASSLARLIPFLWLPRAESSVPVAKVISSRLIAVRPLTGAWLRPITVGLQPPWVDRRPDSRLPVDGEPPVRQLESVQA